MRNKCINDLSSSIHRSGRQREVLVVLGMFIIAFTVTFCGVLAHAQPYGSTPKVGWLAARSAVSGTGLDRLRRHLSVLGYIDGKNISFEFRSANDNLDRLPALARELVNLKVDVLVTPSTAETKAAKNATNKFQ
jgi:putative ABC transport system substrate-binding protein